MPFKQGQRYETTSRDARSLVSGTKTLLLELPTSTNDWQHVRSGQLSYRSSIPPLSGQDLRPHCYCTRHHMVLLNLILLPVGVSQ